MSTLKKLTAIFFLALLTAGAFADDWHPEVYNNEPLEAGSEAIKTYAQQNGSYLSGTDDFAFYHLGHVSIEGGTITPGDSWNYSTLAIVYQNKCWYFMLNDDSNREAGFINFSVVQTDPVPLIYFVYNSWIGCNKVFITWNGTDFVLNSLDGTYDQWDTSDQRQFDQFMEIPSKFYYLQGERVWEDRTFSHNVYTDKVQHLLRTYESGWDRAADYFESHITEDRLRLRTANSKDAKTIKLLDEEVRLRVLAVDPNETQMEGKNGFWVLIQTNEKDVGWIWSNYIAGFDWDYK